MPRTASGLRTDSAARLAELERLRPEWLSWIAMLGEAERALSEELVAITPHPDPERRETPLLHDQTLHVDAAQTLQLILRLVAAASQGEIGNATSLRRYQPTQAELMSLIAAAVRQDGAAIEAVAAKHEVDPGALASVAHLAAFPLLQWCGRLLESLVPRHWPHGYCPICAAWPILAERRGLDRSRRLRCGRCGGQWEVEWLWCIYCGEREHERLGSLEPEDQGEMLKVETCSTCRGYLKSIASLQGFTPFELLLQDLETVELDLVAIDRGYARPEESGFPLEVRVAFR